MAIRTILLAILLNICPSLVYGEGDKIAMFKDAIYSGCVKRGIEAQMTTEKTESVCQCMISTLESSLDKDQLAEYAHAIALGKKDLRALNLDGVDARLSACR